MKSRNLTALAALLLFTSTMHATNGTRMIGFDARSIGRGGAAIGVFDGSSLMMTNPAGIAFLSGPAIDLHASLLVPRLWFSNGVNNQTGRTSYYPLPGLAYVDPGTGGKIAWGLGAFTQGGMGADFSMNHDLFRLPDGSFRRLDYFSQLAVVEGGPAVAFAVTPGFAVGASAHLVYSPMEFRMPYSLSPALLRGVVDPGTGMTFGDMFSAPPAMGGFGYSEVTAVARMTGLNAFGFSGRIGVAWKPNERSSIGLSYTSASPLTYRGGRATMDMTDQLNDAFGRAVQGLLRQNPGLTPQDAQRMVGQMFGQTGIDLNRGVVANYDLEAKLEFPQSIGFGASHAMTESFRLACDVEWVNWKSAFDVMTLNLSDGDNPNIDRILGNDGSFSLEFPLRWEDAFVVRLGTELDVLPELTLRAGAAFGSNPVPAATLFPVFPAVVENHVMGGFTVHITGALALHAAYEYAFNNSEQAAGTSLLAREYDRSLSTLGEDLYHLSLSWIMR